MPADAQLSYLDMLRLATQVMSSARWGRTLLAASAACLAACQTPEDAFVSRCKRDLSRTVECEVSADVVRKNIVVVLDPNSQNRQARVEGKFTLEHGKVAIVLMGCERDARVDVVPGVAVPISCDTYVDTTSHEFSIDAFAFGGEAKGLKGTLRITPF